MALDVVTLNETQVSERIDRSQVMQVVSSALAGLIDGSSVAPAQTLMSFPDASGDCIVYPGMMAAAGVVGVKVSPYLAAASGRDHAVVTAYTLLLSMSDGEPRLLCDSLALTTERTAATTALAIDHLAPDAARTLCVIGSGRAARAHLRYVAGLRSWARISAFSPGLAAGDPARRPAPEFRDLDVIVADSAQHACAGADVVMLCTSSGTPVIDVADVDADALITSIGTNAPRTAEIDPGALSELQVYCDYRRTAPWTAGDFMTASEAGVWNADRILADLPELITGAEKPALTGRRYFRSTGLGVEDIAIASLLL